MTEAMSRREIEDVLTSIKRLVSQEVKGRVSSAVTAPAPEKLVLTPSLRVRDEAEGQVQPTSQSPNPEPYVSDAEEQHPASTPPWPTDPGLSVEKSSDHGASDLPELSAAPVNTSSLLRRIAQAGNPQQVAPTPRQPPEVAAQPDPRPGPEDRDTIHDIFVQPAEDAELEATLARLEAVLSGKAQSEKPGAANALHDTAPGNRADPSAGEQIIDEGMLYQLVAHIVRQELQGELGEKITRNIRKLVRSEVARELQLRRS